MKVSEIIKYYSRKDVTEAMLEIAKDREVIPRYMDGGYGKRPQTLGYAAEVKEAVMNGAVSFHTSVERWRNPMMLSQEMSRRQMDEIRIGWDLLIDVDNKTKDLEFSKICASLLLEALDFHGIKNYGVKFSGGSGWHIVVPYETFPQGSQQHKNNAVVSGSGTDNGFLFEGDDKKAPLSRNT